MLAIWVKKTQDLWMIYGLEVRIELWTKGAFCPFKNFLDDPLGGLKRSMGDQFFPAIFHGPQLRVLWVSIFAYFTH